MWKRLSSAVKDNPLEAAMVLFALGYFVPNFYAPSFLPRCLRKVR